MRILLADDHGLFVEGLKNLLEAGGYEVVGTAYDGYKAWQLAKELHPDLILMDVRMPNCDGLKATRLIKAEMPEIQIVMLTTSAEDEDLFEALKNGAKGYLLKNLKPNVLFAYLEGVARGEAPLSRELSSRLLKEFTLQSATIDKQMRELDDYQTHQLFDIAEQEDHSEYWKGEQPSTELTLRQHEVLELVASGLTYKEVGTMLHVSENTVKYHMGEILQRLHVKNREQVVAYALRHGLVRDRRSSE